MIRRDMMGALAAMDQYDPNAEFAPPFDARIAGGDPSAPPTTRERILDFERSPVGRMQREYREAPKNVWRDTDVAASDRAIAPNVNMNEFAAGPQEIAAADRQIEGGLTQEAIDTLRWHGLSDAAIGLTSSAAVARMVPHPLARAALIAGPIMGALTDPAEAGAGKLFTPAGRIAERQAAGFSKIKGGTPVEAMNWRLQHSDLPIEQRTSMPVDKALRVGDEIIPIVGDATRKLQQGYLTEVGGVPLPKPVLQEGGFDFALGQTVDPRGVQDVWGNAPGAATAIDKLARSALERGNRPVVMSTMMAKTGGDFGSQSFDTARQLTDPKLFSPELLTRIDANMKKNMFSKNDAIKDWPGLTSENLDEFIAGKGGNVRAKLMKVLDQASVIKEGGPDIGMVRVANTNPDLYNTPSGYMGYHIADVTPGTGPAAHSTFPVATHGSNVRGLGGSVPGELVLRDLDAGLRQLHEITGSPQYLNRMDYYAIKPPQEAAVEKGLKPLPRTQVVDQPLIDAIGEHVRRYGLKSVPPAMLASLYGREQMGGVAAQDSY